MCSQSSSLGSDSNPTTLKIQFCHSAVCVCIQRHVTGKACFVAQTQADSANSRDAAVPLHTIGSLRATCQPCRTSVMGRKNTKMWESGSASQRRGVETRVKLRQCRQAYYRDMKETPDQDTDRRRLVIYMERVRTW